jgi:hypothetical protein
MSSFFVNHCHFNRMSNSTLTIGIVKKQIDICTLLFRLILLFDYINWEVNAVAVRVHIGFKELERSLPEWFRWLFITFMKDYIEIAFSFYKMIFLFTKARCLQNY